MKELQPPTTEQIKDLTPLLYAIVWAEQLDLGWEITRDAGRYVSGEHMFDDNGRMRTHEELEPFVEQGEQGYRVMVSLQELTDAVDEPMLYESMGQMANAFAFMVREENK